MILFQDRYHWYFHLETDQIMQISRHISGKSPITAMSNSLMYIFPLLPSDNEISETWVRILQIIVRCSSSAKIISLFGYVTFVPFIFITSVQPPPPHGPMPVALMIQYTGIFSDPTTISYALFSLCLMF